MKRKSIFCILAAGLVALPFGYAAAADDDNDEPKRPRPGASDRGPGRPGGPGGPGGRFERPSFEEIDADKSGDISKEEWVASQVKQAKMRAERSFGFLSGDDEKITKEEMEAVAERLRNRGDGQGRPPRPRGGPGGVRPDGDGAGQKPKRPARDDNN